MSDFVRVSLDIVSDDVDAEKLGEILNNPELLADVGRYLANVALPGAGGVAAVGTTIGGFAHTHRDVEEYGNCSTCRTLSQRNVILPFIK